MTENEKSNKIKNIYSFLEMEDQIEGIKDLKKIFKLASYFGFDNENFNEEFEKVDELKKQFKKLRELPDNFNEHFAEDGWIAYESLNMEIMQEAVSLANEEKAQEAQRLLVDYYNKENIEFFLTRLNGIEEFKPRMELLYKALDDYIEERYHSCIPIVLMMIDGFVNDIKQKGFFASGIDMSVWDTIAAHDSGLNILTKIFGESRKKTIDNKITVPYRNGILHGWDLGYDNKIVAAKTWAALFAISDWARAIKNGKNEEQKEYKSPTFSEGLEMLKKGLKKHEEVRREKQLINEWKPRNIEINNDIPADGNSSEYKSGTPEKTIIKFLEFWQEKNYGNMAKLTTKLVANNKNTIGKKAGEIRKHLDSKKLIKYELTSIDDEAPAITEVSTKLTYKEHNEIKTIEWEFRLIYEGKDKRSLVRGAEKGKWKVLYIFYDLRLE